MDALDVFNSIQDGLVGMTVSELWRGYGSAVFLEFGQLTPNGVRRDGTERHAIGEFSLGIEWSWRIENIDSIVCGTWSDEECWAPAFELVRNRKLISINLYSRLPELDLEFDNKHHLLSFNTTDDQPDWFIIDRRNPDPITLNVENGRLAIENTD